MYGSKRVNLYTIWDGTVIGVCNGAGDFNQNVCGAYGSARGACTENWFDGHIRSLDGCASAKDERSFQKRGDALFE